ncbi:glycosyltransferase [Flavobacterium marginilacus]|uniref:glycosyltransferase n=1 Tax=Flavobacterium marginilacus TaxID=3003256 RepID=UPI00248E7FFA|nr:glycosyltransferase [Flavobacterium marginilacus]
MKLAIITHVIHKHDQHQYLGYAPYIHEMNMWIKTMDEVIVVAPLNYEVPTAIDYPYQHSKIKFLQVPSFSLISIRQLFRTILLLPKLIWVIFQAMCEADHIHLRCPGNIGLLGCLIQILFPSKKKTAKYAGNWDPESKQPWSYRLQQWILTNTFLTRNMQVLVYGEWKNQSKNIVPFYTATYSASDKKMFQEKSLTEFIHFIFVGTLVKGKNPLYAVQLVEELFKKGHLVHLDLYGEGIERERLERYILESNLEKVIELKGNQSKDIVKIGYQNSHFVILPSKSEGWPKAIAEGMFWGCVPIATPVSCVPFMLDFGNRGLQLQMDLKHDVQQLEVLLKDRSDFATKARKAYDWSTKYTVDIFETEIRKMLLL